MGQFKNSNVITLEGVVIKSKFRKNVFCVLEARLKWWWFYIDDRVDNDDECDGCVDNDNEEHGDDE